MSSPITAVPPAPAMVAVQVVLLSPRARDSAADGAGHGLWPVFAIVLGGRDVPTDPRARMLAELLDGPAEEDRIVVVDGWSGWTVLDASRALLRFTLRARRPVRLDLDVIVPARPALELLGLLARGVTVGITTRRHAGALADGAPHRLVLVNGRPAPELAALSAAVRD